jgi:hypothetical protein
VDASVAVTKRVPSHTAWAPSISAAASPPTVGDPAGRDHRHRVDRVHDGRHERQCGRPAAYVPTGLPTLRHDHVDAGVDRPPRLLRTTDRAQVQRPAVVDRVVDRRRVAAEGRDDPDAFGEAGVQPVRDREVEDELTPNRPVVNSRTRRTRAAAPRAPTQVSASIPRPPAPATAATSSGEAAEPIGAWTIGSAIPSRSHRGVLSTTSSNQDCPDAPS